MTLFDLTQGGAVNRRLQGHGVLAMAKALAEASGATVVISARKQDNWNAAAGRDQCAWQKGQGVRASRVTVGYKEQFASSWWTQTHKAGRKIRYSDRQRRREPYYGADLRIPDEAIKRR